MQRYQGYIAACFAAAIAFVSIREIGFAITRSKDVASFWDWASLVAFTAILMFVAALPFLFATYHLATNRYLNFVAAGVLCGLIYLFLGEIIFQASDIEGRRLPFGKRLPVLLAMYGGSGAIGGLVFWSTGDRNTSPHPERR